MRGGVRWTRQRFARDATSRCIKLQRHSGMRHLAQARNPYSLSWLWIPGSRFARPGITVKNSFRIVEERTYLKHVAVGLAGADAQRVIDRRDKNLAVADLPGARSRRDHLHRPVC